MLDTPREEPKEFCRGPNDEAEESEEWLGWKRETGEPLLGSCWMERL